MKIFSTCPFCVPEVEGGWRKTDFNIRIYSIKNAKQSTQKMSIIEQSTKNWMYSLESLNK